MVEPILKRKSKTKKSNNTDSQNPAPVEKKPVDPTLNLKFDEVNNIIELNFKEKIHSFDLKNKWVCEEFQKNIKLNAIV